MAFYFSVVEGNYGIYRYPAGAALPPLPEGFFSLTRTPEEISLVCRKGAVKAQKSEENWAMIKLHGPFDFSMTGVIADIARVLAAAEIPIFVQSTFDTDYLLVKQVHLTKAVAALLLEPGHRYMEVP